MQVRTDIKSSLKGLGKSAADLARHLGVNYEILNRYLNGRAKMPPGVEERITQYMSNNGV